MIVAVRRNKSIVMQLTERYLSSRRGIISAYWRTGDIQFIRLFSLSKLTLLPLLMLEALVCKDAKAKAPS